MSEGRTSSLPRLSTSATHISCPTPKTMSALPRLSCSAQGPTTVVQVPGISHLYGTYPSFLPTAQDVPRRPVNPLRPPHERRNHMTETTEPHLINEERAKRMKQRDHHRYHNAWSKYYYGSAAEQEQYRSYTRAVLKQQMSDKWSSDKQASVDKIQETVMAHEKDRKCHEDDARDRMRKGLFLQSFRDENKKIMEYQWHDRKRGKLDEDRMDREISRYNPINWSGTLK